MDNSSLETKNMTNASLKNGILNSTTSNNYQGNLSKDQDIIDRKNSNGDINNFNNSVFNEKRSIELLTRLVKDEKFDPSWLNNEEIIDLMVSRQVSVYRLESMLGRTNAKRCVEIRRQYYIRELELLDKLGQYQNEKLPASGNNTERDYSFNASSIEYSNTTIFNITSNKINNCKIINDKTRSDNYTSRAEALKRIHTSTEFEYDKVIGACCESVIGTVRVPVGIAGPLKLDNKIIHVPLATTEGCLVASTNRGMSALFKSGGVRSRVTKNCMTRAPIIMFQDPQMSDAWDNVNKALSWLNDPINKAKVKAAFESNSKHTILVDYTLYPFGRTIHIRFEAHTGDAMGMNMCSKGAEMALREIQKVFPTMDIVTLSGNMCTDKKPSAINWINGRGKSIECNACLPADIVEKVLKVSVASLIKTWIHKVMIGSAKAGSIGGFNCHAANIVAAIFLATGQDIAQVVSSSNCLIALEEDSKGSLSVHCSMPSIECGTVGGGTILADQSNYLQLMGIAGSTNPLVTALEKDFEYPCSSYNCQTLDDSDTNGCKLARIICASVMASELSLLASLTEGTLVESHMTHNRSASCKIH